MSYLPAYLYEGRVFVRVRRNKPIWEALSGVTQVLHDSKRTKEGAARSAFEYVGKYLDVTKAVFGCVSREHGRFVEVFRHNSPIYRIDGSLGFRRGGPMFFNDLPTAKVTAKPGEVVVEVRTGHEWRKTTRPRDVRVAEFVRRRVLEAEKEGIEILVTDWRLDALKKFAGRTICGLRAFESNDARGFARGEFLNTEWRGVKLFSLCLAPTPSPVRTISGRIPSQPATQLPPYTPLPKGAEVEAVQLPKESREKMIASWRATFPAVESFARGVETKAHNAQIQGSATRLEGVGDAVAAAFSKPKPKRPFVKCPQDPCTRTKGHEGPHQGPAGELWGEVGVELKPVQTVDAPKVFVKVEGKELSGIADVRFEAPAEKQEAAKKPPARPDIHEICASLAEEIEEKDRKYGSSHAKASKVLAILYPDGLRPDQYLDALMTARIFEKRARVAVAADDDLEDARRDGAAYGILNLLRIDEE